MVEGNKQPRGKQTTMSLFENEQNELSRRRFLRGAGAVGGAAVGTEGAALAAPATPRWNKEADVVVVGGGGSGCAAAVSATQQGAKVLVLESAPALGGAGALCVGSVTVPLSSLQKKAGISDSIDSYMADILAMAGEDSGRMDRTLLRLLAENGGPTIDWLTSLGVDLRGPFEYPGHNAKRMLMLYPRSSVWPGVIRPLLERKGAEILVGMKGVELYRGSDGRVQGVKAMDGAGKTSDGTLNIKARRAVVLTAGNREANPALMEKVTTRD